MKEDEAVNKKYFKARDRAQRLRKFYLTVVRFLIATVVLLLLKNKILEFIILNGIKNEETLKWIDYNIYLIPMIFVILLLIKAFKLFVLKSHFIEDWEERKIQELMNEDRD